MLFFKMHTFYTNKIIFGKFPYPTPFLLRFLVSQFCVKSPVVFVPLLSRVGFSGRPSFPPFTSHSLSSSLSPKGSRGGRRRGRVLPIFFAKFHATKRAAEFPKRFCFCKKAIGDFHTGKMGVLGRASSFTFFSIKSDTSSSSSRKGHAFCHETLLSYFSTLL